MQRSSSLFSQSAKMENGHNNKSNDDNDNVGEDSSIEHDREQVNLPSLQDPLSSSNADPLSGNEISIASGNETENLPSPPNYSKFSPAQIAYAFNKNSKNVSFHTVAQKSLLILKNIALQILNRVSQSSTISPKISIGISTLAIANDSEIPKEVLRILVERTKAEAFLDVTKLQAISLVVAYGGSNLDPNFILESLSAISKKIPSIRLKNDTTILRCLRSINDLLDGLLTMDVVGVVKEGTVKEIFDSFNHLSSTSSQGSKTSTSRLIGMEVKYAYQCLLRITSQKPDYEKLLSTSYSLFKGVVKASCAVANFDPQTLIETVIKTYQDGKAIVSILNDKRKEEWFCHLRLMKSLSVVGFENFRQYYTELFLCLSEDQKSEGGVVKVLSSMTSSAASKEELIFGVLSILNQVVCNQELMEEILYFDETEGEESMKSIREIAILELGLIYLQPSLFGTDIGVRSVIVDFLWQYCSIPEETLQATAKTTLVSILRMVDQELSMRPNDATPESLPRTRISSLKSKLSGSKNDHSHPRRNWFVESDIRARDVDSSHFPYLRSLSHDFSSAELTRDAMDGIYPLLSHIERMRERFYELCLNPDPSSSDLKSDLEMFVPLNCSAGPRDKDQLALIEITRQFLSPTCDQKVLLLHGNAGSGKSLFVRWLESDLWQSFSQGDEASVIPVFVSLPSLKDPTRGVIEETLSIQGFTQRQVNELRNSESYQLLFILDGFDEIQCKQNLYDGNGFGEWRNAKVMMTSRSEYLFGLGNYLSYFGPPGTLREYYICPFDMNQRKSFLDNYVKVGRSAWKASHYEACFDRVSGLIELVTTPFLLRIATEILPTLIDQEGGGGFTLKTNLTRSLLFRKFMEQEFVKSRDQLRMRSTHKEHGLILPNDFDEVISFLKFSMHLAAAMYVSRENSVTIRGSDYRLPHEKDDKWDEFFSSSDPIVIASRFGAPLNCVGRQRSFRHKSLQEYFTALMLLTELSFVLDKSQVSDSTQICVVGSPLTSDSYWNRRYLYEEPSIRDFLLEMMIDPSLTQHDRDAWTGILLAIIESSRIDESLSTACGNSIISLILLGHSFVGSDLSKIHCSGAVFDNADFRNVNFKGSVFRDCSWDGCCLDGCDFGNCDFTNSNIIQERSSLHDSLLTNMLNLNENDVLISTTSLGISLWSQGSRVNRISELKNCDMYSSPKKKWLFLSGGNEGYLFRTENLKDIHWKIENLNCVRDAIALTDDGLYYGIKSDLPNENVTLYYLSLQDRDMMKTFKIDSPVIYQLLGLKVLNPTELFVYWKDEFRWWSTLLQFVSEENKSQLLTAPIPLSFDRFERIPQSPFLFCWSDNRVPFLLHVNPDAISTSPANLSISLQANDCCVSPDGSSLLLDSSRGGFLFSLTLKETETSSSTITFTKLLQVPGMTGPFFPSQFSSDGQLVSLVYGSEIRVIRTRDCACLQLIHLNSQLKRVLFNQHDRELLILKKNSDTIIRRRVDLREELFKDSVKSPSFVKEISCLGSKFFGVTGLCPEDKSLFMERGGLFVRESELITQFRSCGHNRVLRASLLQEALRSQYKEVIQLYAVSDGIDKILLSKLLFPEVITMEYFDGSYLDYLLFLKGLFSCDVESEIRILINLVRRGHVKTIEGFFSEWDVLQGGGDAALYFASECGHQSVCSLLLSHGANVNLATGGGATPLHAVAFHGSESLCALLLSHGANVNQRVQGRTPLFIASQCGHEIMCDLLLSHGADVNQADDDGCCPLYIASVYGHDAVCSVLLRHGAKIDQAHIDGATPLIGACQTSRESVCRVLLQQRADVNQANNDGGTPLHAVSQTGSDSICRLLLSYGAKVNQPMNGGTTPLHLASQNGHESICDLLLSHGADINQPRSEDGRTPLWIASQLGHVCLCTLLLSHGAVNLADENGCTPLCVASLQGHHYVCALLLSHGVDVNQRIDDGCSPLWVACGAGHVSVCELLLKHGADVNQATNNGITPLSVASQFGHESVCDLLLSHGAEVNQAFLIASREGHESICRLFLKHGENPNQVLIDGRTPLYVASQHGHDSLCLLFLDHGANVNETQGSSPLFIASQEGHASVCAVLLSHEANVNQARNNGCTPLCIASLDGHDSVCDLLLTHGADVHQADEDGATPLMMAAENGHIYVCELLVNHGALVNQTMKDGYTPLYIASLNGHASVCELLLTHGADVNQADEEGNTSLMMASQNGHLSVCAILLSHGADVNHARKGCSTPLWIASQGGHDSVCALLLNHGANINLSREDGTTPLYISSQNGYVHVCVLLLNRGADVNQADTFGHTPLWVASQEGHDSLCVLLLSHGADVNQTAEEGVTPLWMASQNGHVSVCGQLLRHGADVNQPDSDGCTPLSIACQQNHSIVIELLLDRGADVNQAKISGSTPLFIASQEGHDSVCDLLLDHGATINQARNGGWTPLYIACDNGHEFVCHLLISRGADPSQADDDGRTPLWIASRKGHKSVCELLLSQGADVNQVDDVGITPLYVASHQGHEPVCCLLLSNGAQVNQAMSEGCTPLYTASSNGHDSVCDLLLSHGAHVNQAMNEGATPLYIASQMGHSSVCALLLNHGANIHQADDDGHTPLWIASQMGHGSVCALLTNHGANIHQADEGGSTPLWIASRNGHKSVCELLLSLAADVNKAANDGSSPLLIASQEGREFVCRLLLNLGADVNQAMNEGLTPLFIASQEGHESICRLLLSRGAKVNLALNSGATPLWIASKRGHESLCALLLSHGADANQAPIGGPTPLWVASFSGNESICDLLLTHGADANQVSKDGFAPLFVASQQGHETICALMLSHGADANQVSKNGSTPLLIASQVGHASVCDLLLSHGAHANQAMHNGCTPLLMASQGGHEYICGVLLTHGAGVNQGNEDGLTPLSVASQQGHLTICALLLSHGADANQVSKNGSTPLLIASQVGHASVCDLLLSHGAHANQAMHNGCTPLLMASQGGHEYICGVLLTHGAGVNQGNEDGLTPLSVASQQGHLTICALLLSHGAEVNQTRNNGSTPLWAACYNGHESVCRLLFARGAHLHQASIDGSTPLHVAAGNGHDSVCALLLNNGVEVNQAALWVASRYGQESVCALLLNRGADANQPGNDGSTPLWVASQHGHDSVRTLLLSYNAIEIQPKQEVTGSSE